MAAKTASDSQTAIANRIKHLLNEKGKSRKEMATDLRVTTETLNSWASRGSIKRDNLTSFARYVGTTTDYLLAGEEQATPEALIQQKDDGVVQWHMPVPVLETNHLHGSFLADPVPRQEPGYARSITIKQIDNWIENPRSTTQVYVPYLVGHLSEPSILPGTPRYAVQVSVPDHGEELNGRIVCMSTEVWPNRDDFSLFLCRTVVGDNPSLWSLHSGFYRSDSRAIPNDLDSWWQHAADNKIDRGFVLRIEKDRASEDDVQINFQQHQWFYLGVMVYSMGWSGQSQTLAHTRLMERKMDNIKRRRRVLGEAATPTESLRTFAHTRLVEPKMGNIKRRRTDG